MHLSNQNIEMHSANNSLASFVGARSKVSVDGAGDCNIIGEDIIQSTVEDLCQTVGGDGDHVERCQFTDGGNNEIWCCAECSLVGSTGNGSYSDDGGYFCNECNRLMCQACRETLHGGHAATRLKDFLASRRLYVQKLAEQLKMKQERHERRLHQVETAQEQLDNTKKSLERAIRSRADCLSQMVFRRRDDLLRELEKEYASCVDQYRSKVDLLMGEMSSFDDSVRFAEAVIAVANLDDIVNLHDDITSQLNRLVNHVEEARLELLSMHIDIPEAGKEESLLDRLFGLLVRGNVSCGGADLLLTFNVNLQWPTSFAMVKGSRDFAIAGKSGAFASEGKVLFYDRLGGQVATYVFEENCLPLDMVSTSGGDIFVSDSRGRIIKFTSAGRLVEIWEDRFAGGSAGRMALTNNGLYILVSSSSPQKCIRKYMTSDCRLVETIQLRTGGATSDLIDVNSIATNSSSDIVVSVSETKAVHVFSACGRFLHTYPDTTVAASGMMKCPSAVACDPFGNILVADFTGDCIHLIAQSGQFVGRMLTCDDGISCPNFVVLDPDGHLCVGQYGGEILLFRYLSYVKHA